uniref:Sushi domain-containing protein n=1 Tax=Chromera velia CCMP2878 TaxID=1169474 RepID=A0A0G4GGB9_9ALVE|eukprot:Cvel_21771.t1-p1 / transcript=Cvel_21771.t1 / gene=Cvel_21771 / organism=Chromera_velia_CCMP2878 / gene_product=Fibrillin-2, putative / transcript_product=Fibrillin-2, putative / location=Cvel_scaffold2071:11598-19037(+) / protein_length=682 / sequence_SO=supercontig / SO=protein_coding / is_pseudo=false
MVIDDWSNPLASFTTTDANGCQAACAANAACYFWTWFDNAGGDCRLQEDHDNPERYTSGTVQDRWRLVSGPKFCECYEVGKRVTGDVIAAFPTSLSATKCQQRCDDEPLCNFFSFSHATGNCTLHSGNTTVISDAASITAAEICLRDECSRGFHNCNPEASCNNTDGSFTYACNAGWDGDGLTCIDVDECSDPAFPHNCDAVANCTNTVASFLCACPATGWYDMSNNTGVNCTSGVGTNCIESFQVLCGSTVSVSSDNVAGTAAADVCAFAAGEAATLITFDWGSGPWTVGNQQYPERSYHVSTCSSTTDFDSQDSVTNLSDAVCLGTQADDGASGCSVRPDAASVWLSGTMGEFYNVRVAGTSGSSGSFSLAVSSNCTCTDSKYTLVGELCNYDECALGVHRCSRRTDYSNVSALELGDPTVQTATCTDTDASYTCSCKLEFEDKGVPMGMEAGLFCEPVKCAQQPTFPSNGVLSFSDPVYTFTTQAETAFQCNAGYVLSTSTFLPSGKMDCFGTSQTTSSWPAASAICEAVVCGGQTPVAPYGGVMTPSSPPNGINWVTGDSVTFSCNAGYSYAGPSTLSCEGVEGASPEASEWPSHSAVCQGVPCTGIPPAPPLGGTMNPSVPPFDGVTWLGGDIVTSQCNSPYHTAGGSPSKSCVIDSASGGAVWDESGYVSPTCAVE